MWRTVEYIDGYFWMGDSKHGICDPGFAIWDSVGRFVVEMVGCEEDGGRGFC